MTAEAPDIKAVRERLDDGPPYRVEDLSALLTAHAEAVKLAEARSPSLTPDQIEQIILRHYTTLYDNGLRWTQLAADEIAGRISA